MVILNALKPLYAYSKWIIKEIDYIVNKPMNNICIYIENNIYPFCCSLWHISLKHLGRVCLKTFVTHQPKYRWVLSVDENRNKCFSYSEILNLTPFWLWPVALFSLSLLVFYFYLWADFFHWRIPDFFYIEFVIVWQKSSWLSFLFSFPPWQTYIWS